MCAARPTDRLVRTTGCHHHQISAREPPSPPLVRLVVARLERDIDRYLERLEFDLVSAVTEALDATIRPFPIVERAQVWPTGRTHAVVIANAVAAASHAAMLDQTGRRQVEFLSIACPDMHAGVGWLRRLDRRLGVSSDVLGAAADLAHALREDSWWEARLAASGSNGGVPAPR